MFGIGGSEIVFIALFALLLFGPARLPELARSIARAYREFLKFRQQMTDAVDDLRADIDIDLDDEPAGGRAPGIRAPAGTRISAGGAEHGTTGITEPLIELEVPDEDDYLEPGRLAPDQEAR
jgi:TatA/E family protein of Tat protein translocase